VLVMRPSLIHSLMDSKSILMDIDRFGHGGSPVRVGIVRRHTTKKPPGFPEGCFGYHDVHRVRLVLLQPICLQEVWLAPLC